MTQDTTIEDVLKKHLGNANIAWFKKDYPQDYNSIYAAMTEWASLQTPSNEKYGWVKASERLPEFEKNVNARFDQEPTCGVFEKPTRGYPYFNGCDDGKVLFQYFNRLEWLDESTPIPIQTPCVELEKEVERLKDAIKQLYPHCHEENMKGETDYKKAWLNAEQLLNL